MILMSATAQPANATDPAKTVQLELSTGGPVVIELLPEIAPKHVERIKTLASEGFYDNLTFHRVIRDFMAQTGDPTGTGRGGSKYDDLPAEFSHYQYKRGTVGMARTENPNSANSQFFICFTDSGCRGLTGQYTVWGQVTSGMEYVDALAIGEPPGTPDKIVKMTVGEEKAPEDANPASGTPEE
ncbi:MAG: peptidylprolyl isomerase [Alphaproteobacteria bacterium]|nr:peptidylprolyl isomerase [Alphaproteobacteria bacterium]MCB1839155.1 peptidylprolyl isomerase [Alphaproteobacteria bacterium]